MSGVTHMHGEFAALFLKEHWPSAARFQDPRPWRDERAVAAIDDRLYRSFRG